MTTTPMPNMSGRFSTEPADSSIIADTTQRLIAGSLRSGFIVADTRADERYVPQLIANQGGRTMEDALIHELDNSNGFSMSVAFVTQSVIQTLKQHFLNFHDHNHAHAGSIITSTYNYFNSPQAFRELHQLQQATDIDVRVWERPDANGRPDSDPSRNNYHPKGYVFCHTINGQDAYTVYIGSSNLTENALRNNREWNLRVPSLHNGRFAQELEQEIKLQREQSVPLDDAWIEAYEEEFKRHAPLLSPSRRSSGPDPTQFDNQQTDKPIEPNTMQREALANLRRLRAQGETRAIVISATGTGKTYLSAFDVKQCHPKRMLYLVHRQEILTKAMDSYRLVLGCSADKLGLYTGNDKRGADRQYVFSTVQTMAQSSVLDSFPTDAFDYILIDEAHHAAAETYKRIIDHFTPKFLLGMTATPERNDSGNIFDLFGNNIAYEIRLQRALEEDMLCPFHYYGVSEFITETAQGLPDTGVSMEHTNDKDRAALRKWVNELTADDRVSYIVDKLRVYGQAGEPVKGIVFCSRVEEAQILAEKFTHFINEQAERPYRTACLTGASKPKEREQVEQALQHGELDYIFTVDLFNEGIDIPATNQIVMLRQTQSSIVFTQQLGRGLRKYPGKSSVVVVDFIGNYANNYLIPIALYGNSGDRDRVRKNLGNQAPGLCSISFDPIARKRVLDAIDHADLSDMRKLSEQYRELRRELNRIPMLMDIAARDTSLVYTMASKSKNYLAFVRSRERSLNAKNDDADMRFQLDATSSAEDGMLTMLTDTQLRGLRPHELVALALLAGIDLPFALRETLDAHTDTPARIDPMDVLDTPALQRLVSELFPACNSDAMQCESALRVLDYSYFNNANRSRFGGTPMIERLEDDRVRLSDPLRTSLQGNATFRRLFVDTVQAGLTLCFQRYQEAHGTASKQGLPLSAVLDHGFIVSEKYSLFDVMRMCGWTDEQIPQNVGGYRYDESTGTMPIFIKYESSQYQDRFIDDQDIEWFSKNNRSLESPEFQWIRETNDKPWQESHFVPVFIRRKVETKETTYYYVGRAASIEDSHEETNRGVNKDGEEIQQRVVVSNLHLIHPVPPDLLRHLTDEQVG